MSLSAQDVKQFLALTVTNNLNDLTSERRFPSDITVMGLKGKLELLTGASTATMKLELKNEDGDVIQRLLDDTVTLAQLGVQDGMKIHVIDVATTPFDSEDSPDVAFQLNPEEYEKRQDSALNFLKQNKLGRFDEEKMKLKQQEEEQETKLAENIKVGDRCEIQNPTRRGEVMHVGPVHFKDGIWVGIKYDEPLGKNDGSVKGKRYFDCKPNYGGFVRPSAVKVGDYPEIDELDEI